MVLLVVVVLLLRRAMVLATSLRIMVAITMLTLIPSLIPMRLSRQRRRRLNTTTLQININPPFILLSRIIEPELLAQLLDSWLDLLHPASRVVPLADDDMQMGLAGSLGVPNARLEDVLCLLDKLAVQVNGVLGYPAGRIVLPEDEVGGLLVVLGLLFLMALARVGELLGFGAVAALIGFMGLELSESMLHRFERR